MVEPEVPLVGGNSPAAVVRVGATVRKSVTAVTPGVEAVLRHLERVGFSGAPRTLGRDAQGRQVLEQIDGPLALGQPPMTLAQLARVGRLVRDLHEALSSFAPAPDAQWDLAIRPDREELVCHHDLAPWNLVLGDDRWVFIDWDGAGPGSASGTWPTRPSPSRRCRPAASPPRTPPGCVPWSTATAPTPSSAGSSPRSSSRAPGRWSTCSTTAPPPAASPGPGCTPRGTAGAGAALAEYVAEHLDLFARAVTE